MVILMNDLPREVSEEEVRRLVEHYHPVKAVEVLKERPRAVDWRVDLGDTDREVANFVIDHLHGLYWNGRHLYPYCPLYQSN